MTGDNLTVLHSVNRKHAAKQFTLITNKKTGERKIKNRSYASKVIFGSRPSRSTASTISPPHSTG
jgi:hypothetical protein